MSLPLYPIAFDSMTEPPQLGSTTEFPGYLEERFAALYGAANALPSHFGIAAISGLDVTIAGGALPDGTWQGPQTVAMAPSANNYLEISLTTGTVALGSGMFTAGLTPLFFFKTDSGSILNLDGDNPALDEDDSIPDRRGWAQQGVGFANPMTTLGDTIYGGVSGVATRRAGNTTTTRKWLRSTGSGGLATAPDWDTLLFADLPDVTATRLLGRGSVAGDGSAQEITLGTGLTMSGTTLNASDSAANSRTITQAAHGLAAFKWLRFDGTIYTYAANDTAPHAEVVGIVAASPGTNDFVLVSDGYISGLSGLTPGAVYFLDTGGDMIATAPTTAGQVRKPLFVAVSATAGYVQIGQSITLTALTANRAVISDGLGALTASSVTSTELGYISGVTGAVQTQLDARAVLAASSQVFTGANTFASVKAAGTAGAGYLELVEQASAPATPTNAARLFVDGSNRLGWVGENGFVRTFDGTANTANRVYVLPDVGGTIAVLSAVGQTFTADNVFSAASALSTPAVKFTGAVITGGSATTNKPHVLIEPSGATSTNWGVNGTLLGGNAASGYTGELFNFQLNGANRFRCDSTGLLTGISMSLTGNLTGGGNGIFGTNNTIGWTSKSRLLSSADGKINLTNVGGTAFTSLAFGLENNTFPMLKRSSATLAVRLADDTGDAALSAGIYDAGTTTVTTALTLSHNSTGTPAAGFGGNIVGVLESSTTEGQSAIALEWKWAQATHASRKAEGRLFAYDTAARECIAFGADGSNPTVGLYGVAPVARPAAYTQTYATATRTHSNAAQTAVATTGATNVTPYGYTTAAQADDIVTQLNAARTDILNLKQVLNQVIDDLQALGPLQ